MSVNNIIHIPTLHHYKHRVRETFAKYGQEVSEDMVTDQANHALYHEFEKMKKRRA